VRDRTPVIFRDQTLTVKFWFIPKGKDQGTPRGFSKETDITINTLRIGQFVVGWEYYTNEDYYG
jgi:hypothetical protein